MRRLPLDVLFWCQRKRELLHGNTFSGTCGLLVNSCRSIGFGSSFNKPRYIQCGLSDKVVARQLVPIEYTELNVVLRFISPNVEEELLLPDWVERVTNNSSTEDFLAKGGDHEGIHIPACASHCEGYWQWFDLKYNNALLGNLGRSVAFSISIMTIPSTSLCEPRLYEVGMLEVRLNRGRPLLMELLLAAREGTGRGGASIPPAVVGPTRPPVVFSLLIEFADGDRPKKDEMKFDFFFSVSDAGVGGSARATTAVLATIVAAAGGGFWDPSSSASSSERP